jgi:phosphoribosylcarboxyaminoimidazole (NCAIR) mutase
MKCPKHFVALHLAAQLLGIVDPVVAQKVTEDRQRNAKTVIDKDTVLQESIKNQLI